jgi:hypothetical protein
LEHHNLENEYYVSNMQIRASRHQTGFSLSQWHQAWTFDRRPATVEILTSSTCTANFLPCAITFGFFKFLGRTPTNRSTSTVAMGRTLAHRTLAELTNGKFHFRTGLPFLGAEEKSPRRYHGFDDYPKLELSIGSLDGLGIQGRRVPSNRAPLFEG